MSYQESKKQIEEIRCSDEVLFRMAISHLMDVGMRHLTEESVKSCCDEIMMEDDSKSFMTNNYKCAIVKTAHKLSQINHIHLLNYISKEVYYDVGDTTMPYDRMLHLLDRCMDWIEGEFDKSETLDTFKYLGFSDEELEEFGFGYLIEEEEE